MASFDIHDISALLGEVRRHNASVLADDLQPYNDLLFNIIAQEIHAKHDDIMEDFKTKIQETYGTVNQVTVPLWSYKTRFYKKPKDVYEAELSDMPFDERHMKRCDKIECDRICIENGWHWTIGVIDRDPPIVWKDDVEKFLPDMWTLRPVPVNLIVFKTDLLIRLSTLFTGNVVKVERFYGKLIHETRDYEIREMWINATLYPRGLRGHQKNAVIAALEKYSHDYAPTYLLSTDEDVVMNGPGLEPPKTPPASPSMTPVCPPAPKRRPVYALD